MIDIKDIKRKIKNDFKNNNENIKIIVKSFKKDRLITISIINNDIIVEENGFKKEINKFDINNPDILKYIYKILDYEFPNSNKLWYSIKKV